MNLKPDNYRLAAANRALREQRNLDAMKGYVECILALPNIKSFIDANLVLVRKRIIGNELCSRKTKAVVCSWELAHNAAGRAHTLAEIYKEVFDEVEILGCISGRWGGDVWEPIRETDIRIYKFLIDPTKYLEQLVQLIIEHPANIVHLSKPRAPNIFFGVFYKIIWDAKVIVDIDEEELAFVKAEEPLDLDDYLNENLRFPLFDELADRRWTRIAVGMAREFDGITVSNKAIQIKYGGIVIGHARDPRVLHADTEVRKKRRNDLGILPDEKVVLFSGTPRPHKGLIEVAQAIQGLNRRDIIFVIAGSFTEGSRELKCKLKQIKNVKYIFVENQPFDKLKVTLSIADCCVMIQDLNDVCSKYQIPAKLTDALAMGIPVISTATDAMMDVVEYGAVLSTSIDDLPSKISMVLDNPSKSQTLIGKRYFDDKLSIMVNSSKLKSYIKKIKLNKPKSIRIEKFIKYCGI